MAYPGLGFPHHAGWYHPGGSPCSSPVSRSWRFMQGFVIRGWDQILPGWRWLYEPQPISDQPEGLGIPHRAWEYRPGGSPVSSPNCFSCRCMERFDPCPPRVPLAPRTPFCCFENQVCTDSWRTRSRTRLVLNLACGIYNYYSIDRLYEMVITELGVSTPCGAVSTQGTTVFVPGSSEM